MKKCLLALSVVALTASVSFAEKPAIPGMDNADRAVTGVEQAGAKPVNQMIKAPAAAPAPNQDPNKAVATWTNPNDKEITNHGMAKKLENQEKNAAKKAEKEQAGEANVAPAVDLNPAQQEPAVAPAAAQNVVQPVPVVEQTRTKNQKHHGKK